MASGRPQRRNDPSVMSSLESAVREIQRPGLIESAWNWRWELGTAAVTAGLSAAIARTWCIITPHRVRVGCVNAWVQTRRGKLPLVLTTTPTDSGERVQLWCRAGITVADLLAARDVLAASCWAAEVRVIPSVRHAHLVTLEVIRNHYTERPVQSPPDWPFYRRAEGGLAGEDPEESALAQSHWNYSS